MAWTRNRPIGLTYRDPDQAQPGYTLFSSARGHRAFLLDDDGQIVHSWSHPDGLHPMPLLDDGRLLAHFLPPDETVDVHLIGGAAAGLVELDWDSNVMWEYRDPYLHHDFQRLPNGNTLVIAWDSLPVELVGELQGGHEHE